MRTGKFFRGSLDHQLHATTEFAPYRHVISENPDAFVVTTTGLKIPLQRAVDRGLVVVEGTGDRSTPSGLAVRFTSRSSTVAKIIFAKPTAFGESSEGLVAENTPILTELEKQVPGETSRQKNDRIWTAQSHERMLHELGFYGNRPVNPANTQIATSKFQSSVGIETSGEMDVPTIQKLEEENNRLLVQLKKVGFEYRNPSTKVVAVSGPLRDFQEYHGIDSDGRLSPPVETLLTREASLADDVQKLYQTNEPVASLLSGTAFPNIVTAFRRTNDLSVLAKNGDDLDYWIFDGNTYNRGGLGDDGIGAFDQHFQETLDALRTEDLDIISTSKISNLELAFLEAEKAKEPDRPKAVFIAVSPFQQGRPIPELSGIPTATRLARALRSHFGDDLHIFIGQDPRLGIENSKKLPALTGPQELKFYTDGKRIDDRGIVNSLAERLDDLDIDVVEAQEVKPGEAAVGVVVGKNDENMRSVLMNLAKQRTFNGGILALAKCGNPDDVAFNSELIRTSGARAVIFYDERIQPQAVKQVLIALIKRLRAAGVADGDWATLFRHSVDDAAADSAGNQRLEILKLKEAHIQTSLLAPLTTSNEEPEIA